MATVIHATTPQAHSDADVTIGMVLGIIVAAALLVLLFMYGIPYLQSSSQTPSTASVQQNNVLPSNPSVNGNTNNAEGSLPGTVTPSPKQ